MCAAVLAGSGLLLQIGQRPVDAAQQSATAAAKASPPANAQSDPGAASYAEHCAICHGPQRQGNLPEIPPLVGISHRMTAEEIAASIHKGGKNMPAFDTIQGVGVDGAGAVFERGAGG